MPADTGSKSTNSVVAGVVVLVVAAGVVYATAEWGPWNAGAGASSGSDASAARAIEVSRRPLPDSATTLPALLSLATADARSWRQDARLARLYATEVASDGAIERGASSVQVVFLSDAAAAEGPPTSNGFRWAAEQGMFYGAEIMQHPPPQSGSSEPRLCDLAPIVGADGPPRVTLDVQFATPPGVPPSMQAFADRPAKWLAVADPVTCAVQMRSGRATAQEASAAPSAPVGAPAPGEFDLRAAERAVDAVLARASACGVGDGGQMGTLSVAFAMSGGVQQVDIEPESLRSSSGFGCIADRLRLLQVASWQRGAGRVVRRMQFQ